MKRCSFCGRQHDDSTDVCNECGSPIVSTEVKPGQAIKGPCREPEETPSPPLAQKDGTLITLKCRTPGEAYLVKAELEQSDIVAILPEDEALYLEYKRNGYVEIQVSAKAYSSIPDLQSVVEFQYEKVLRSDQPLPLRGKAFAMGCAVLPVPGLLVFAWLLSSYRTNGNKRMAKEFKLWFLLGVASWILCILVSVCLTSFGGK